MINNKGVILIIILLVVAGLATSIAITIPREVRQLQRNEEERLRDSLVAIENSINAALREYEFHELFFYDINDLDGDGVTNEIYITTNPQAGVNSAPPLYIYDPTNTPPLPYINWEDNPGTTTEYKRVIRGELAKLFLDNISYEKGFGYLPDNAYRINRKDSTETEYIGPILTNSPSRWVIMISESTQPLAYIKYEAP
jgi:type II secretory pathway pseudopilin PulG